MTGGFAFRYGPRVVAGPGASATLAAHLPPGPVLFVTDAGILGLGLARPALAALRSAGHEIILFDAVEPDPSAETVLRAADAGRAGRVASVVGFGGGSPMDVAKLAACLLGSAQPLEDMIGVDRARGPRLPLVLVPTTAGTGSEATPIAILSVGGVEKKGVVAAPLVADLAVLDPELTFGLPRAITAATGIDAMVHAIEAYTSARLKNPISDALAREALRLLAGHLLRACDMPGDGEARAAMLLGSHLAGVAFANAPVAAVHALAYPVGGRFHVPHGHSNALMLGPVLRHNLPAAGALYAELAPLLGASGADGFVEAVLALCAATGLPLRLREVGVDERDLPVLAQEAMRQERLLVNNPAAVTEADALRLYAEAW